MHGARIESVLTAEGFTRWDDTEWDDDHWEVDDAIGAVLNKRYLQSTKYVKNAASDAERKKFLAMVELFRKYGEQYKFDYLMMAAQGYQESGLNQDARSPVGAIGVMQIMPETGRILNVGDITKVEPNIHAGVKHMRSLMNTFFENEPMDELNKGLFTFAAYNAGGGRVRPWARTGRSRRPSGPPSVARRTFSGRSAATCTSWLGVPRNASASTCSRPWPSAWAMSTGRG